MRRNNLNDFGVLHSDRLKMSRLLSLNKKQNFRQLFYLKLMVFREDESLFGQGKPYCKGRELSWSKPMFCILVLSYPELLFENYLLCPIKVN